MLHITTGRFVLALLEGGGKEKEEQKKEIRYVSTSDYSKLSEKVCAHEHVLTYRSWFSCRTSTCLSHWCNHKCKVSSLLLLLRSEQFYSIFNTHY